MFSDLRLEGLSLSPSPPVHHRSRLSQKDSEADSIRNSNYNFRHMEIWNYIKAEWSVLSSARLTFATLLILGLGAGFEIGKYHYEERLNEQEGQIKRYRVALGI